MSRSTRRQVVSADDVRAARDAGETRVAVPAGALVTPLAREEAARWGLDLVEAAPSTELPPAPHAPTCDPPASEDDVERVVARVRALVPEADIAQVREITRRVLARWRS